MGPNPPSLLCGEACVEGYLEQKITLPAPGTPSKHTGIPRSQENPAPSEPPVEICLGPYRGPRGGDVRTLGEIPAQPHCFSFHLWCLTDITSSPRFPTSVHWGKSLRTHLSLFLNFANIRTLGRPPHGLTSEVSVVGAHESLTTGYHGPSADLLHPGVCASLYLFDLTQMPD